MSLSASSLPQLLSAHERDILGEWQRILKAGGLLQSRRISDAELETQCREFLMQFRTSVQADPEFNLKSEPFEPLRHMLVEISRTRAAQGFSPSETVTFVFSLKQPLFDVVSRSAAPAEDKTATAWRIALLLDELGLFTMEVYQRAREEVIARQSQEIAELSTPVVKLWDGVLALPLIGTLDSQRTQVVMENLLQSIVDHAAEIAIIDITGVPTVDTLTAQHLLRTVAAARLMGADCIISGIRPQIAQTMVHLGVELNVVSKANLADAFALALRRSGRAVVAAKTTERPGAPGQA